MNSNIPDIKIIKQHFPGPFTFFPVLVVLGMLIMYGCTYPYEPKIRKYENVLVVDGLLTNIQGNCYVTLSRTYPYNGKPSVPEEGAVVKIIDDLDNETLLSRNEKGIYLPKDTSYSGDVGRKYKLMIRTSQGETIESGFEELKEPVDIDNIYFEFMERKNGTPGLQIYLNTHDPAKKSFYYSWDFDETWEFWVPYNSQSVYLPEMKICYKNVSSRKVLIESTKDYIDDKVIGFPLYFIDNSTNRLYVKYSVLVRQYVLTEGTYQFYKDLKDINEHTGTLFDRTPVILTGNMINTLNPEQPVLGNFQVSGASERRLFIYRDQIRDLMTVPSEFEYCEVDLLSKINGRPKIDSLLREGWAIMDTIYDTEYQDTLFGLAIRRACFDCTLNGDITKPDFWDEK